MNNNAGDGCNNCLIETGWTCTHTNFRNSVCSPICGDGRKLGNEQCDDGNLSNFDG